MQQLINQYQLLLKTKQNNPPPPQKNPQTQAMTILFTFIECVDYVFHRLSQDVSEYELATLNKISKEQGKINSPAAASAYEYLMNSWKEQKGVELRKLF